MKYTEYLAAMVKTQGAPQMDESAFGQVMNIVHLEGRMAGLIQFKSQEKNRDFDHKYDLEIMNYQRKINLLTQGYEPKEFISKLLRNRVSS